MVRLGPGHDQLIPLTVTDRAMTPLNIFPIPLDRASVEQLLHRYQSMVKQLREQREDETNELGRDYDQPGPSHPASNGAGANSIGSGLGQLDRPAATAAVSADSLVGAAPGAVPEPAAGGER